MLPLLTVIVPAHNAARTIVRAVDSILIQGSDKACIIIIDDASDDDTGAIIRTTYAKEIDKGAITLLTMQKNGGPAAARQLGMDSVKTPYLTFLDADDRYERDDALTIMTEQIRRTEPDMLMFNYIMDYGNVSIRKGYKPPKGSIMSGSEALADKIRRENNIWHYVWNKCYRTAVIREHGVAFHTELQVAEDVRFNDDFLQYARTVTHVDEYLYRYDYTNAASLANKAAARKMTIDELEQWWNDSCERCDRLSKMAPALIDTLHHRLCLNMLTISDRATKEDRKELMARMKASAHYEKVKQHLPSARLSFAMMKVRSRLRQAVKRLIVRP